MGDKDATEKKWQYVWMTAFAMAVVLSVFEYVTFGEHNMYVGTLFAVLLIMNHADRFPHTDNPVLYHIGRNLSNHVYFWHVLILAVFNKVSNKWPVFHVSDKIKPLVILGLALGLAEGIYCIRENGIKRIHAKKL